MIYPFFMQSLIKIDSVLTLLGTTQNVPEILSNELDCEAKAIISAGLEWHQAIAESWQAGSAHHSNLPSRCGHVALGRASTLEALASTP